MWRGKFQHGEGDLRVSLVGHEKVSMTLLLILARLPLSAVFLVAAAVSAFCFFRK